MARKSSRSLAVRSAELAVAAPLVITHRLARIAAAGHQPGARDRAENLRMGTEKIAAFNEGWFAVGVAMWRMQQQVAWSMWRSMWFPWTGAARLPQPHHVMQRLMSSAIAPVHRRAMANAKRLGNARRR